MARLVLGVFGGFVAWLLAWFGGEQLLSALWPASFGAQQQAFQAALEHGNAFSAQPSFLLTHLLLATVVSLIAGVLAVLIAAGRRRASVALGIALLALGLLKAGLSWPLVPLWYHLAFTAILASMPMLGGRLKRTP